MNKRNNLTQSNEKLKCKTYQNKVIQTLGTHQEYTIEGKIKPIWKSEGHQMTIVLWKFMGKRLSVLTPVNTFLLR